MGTPKVRAELFEKFRSGVNVICVTLGEVAVPLGESSVTSMSQAWPNMTKED
jgi:hypothetical protein